MYSSLGHLNKFIKIGTCRIETADGYRITHTILLEKLTANYFMLNHETQELVEFNIWSKQKRWWQFVMGWFTFTEEI